MTTLAAALDFGTHMIELGASTFGRLIEIQLRDLATFIERQRVATFKTVEVRDVSGLLALRRDHEDQFWRDRGSAMEATADVLRVATERVRHCWGEMMNTGTQASVLLPAVPAKTKSRSNRVSKEVRATVKRRMARKKAPE